MNLLPAQEVRWKNRSKRSQEAQCLSPERSFTGLAKQFRTSMNTADSSTNPYDEVLYPEAVHVHTPPDRLATVAVLRGMRPTSVDHCRLVEFGCGVGSNLIAMAFNY